MTQHPTDTAFAKASSGDLAKLSAWHTTARARAVMASVGREDFRFGIPYNKLFVDREHIPVTEAGSDALERLSRLLDEAFRDYLGMTPDDALKLSDAGHPELFAEYVRLSNEIANAADAIGHELARRDGCGFQTGRPR